MGKNWPPTTIRTASEIEAERLRFKADRHPSSGRTTYLAHGKGYVMVRHPGCIPFIVTEAEWLEMPLWEKPIASEQQAP